MKTFQDKIQAALQDPVLQSALDANAIGRRQAWTAAFEAMPYDLEEMRQKAHQIRKEVIDNLDEYVDQFVRQAQANGFIVHRAKDAESANQIVIEIAQKHGAGLLAKSKTMVSEEIELNHALETAGIRPVETDLGEYIVQLRKERPSHIITPSVHLKKDQVGRTFEEHLHQPYTDDIQVLTDTARKTLREIFLSADIGLSGVNLAIAEAGAIGILTNEGNGRMVTTLPPVHIALLGIERLVPSYDDFCTLLALLPRASTGQPITVYTQIIQGPRKEGELDGAQERHIILVDNRRSRTQKSWLSDSLMCIRCGACLNACPIFREIGGHAYVDANSLQTPYPGPIGSVVSPALFGEGRYGHLAQASTLCGACKDACPVDIDLPGLLLRTRAGSSSPTDNQNSNEGIGISRGIRAAMKVFSWIAVSTKRYSFAQGTAGAVTDFLGSSPWMHLPKFTGWGFSKDIHKPAPVPFRQRWEKLQQNIESSSLDQKPAPTSPDSRQAAPDELRSLQGKFTHSLRDLDGIVIECDGGQLPGLLIDEFKKRNIHRVAAWDSLDEKFQLVTQFSQAGILIETELSQAQAGITRAFAGVAETGSIVQLSSAGNPNAVSLLPPVHIAVLDSSRIYKNLPQILRMEEVQKSSAVTIISGPSRTADIEMTLTIGVHGPREMIVFILH